MDLAFSEDQAALVGALDRLVRDHIDQPLAPSPFVRSPELERELVAGGFLDVAREGFGVMGAVLLIEAIGRTPYAVELAASALVAPALGLTGLPRALAMIGPDETGAIRFLEPGGAALVDAGDHLRLLRCGDRVTAVDSFLAFPFGRFDGDAAADSEALPGIDIDRFRTLRRIAVSAEIVAAMDRALDVTVDYIKQRQQFGQPIGSFQAVGHRVAECASIVHGARLLLHRAAVGEDREDAAVAMTFAQDASKRLIWETNQLHGAIALTLEYPLHCWNYRLRVLQGEMGGAFAAAGALAEYAWPPAKAA